MEDIKAYKSKSKSISSSQILFEDYDCEKALTVLSEMTLAGCQRMLSEHVIANNVSIYVGYSKDIAPPSGGSMKMSESTNLYSIIIRYVQTLYKRTTYKDVPIRRLGITFGGIADEGCEGYDLFTDFEKVEREKKVERAVLEIKKKFGKNALLRAIDLKEEATQVERNKMIGGHNSD